MPYWDKRIWIKEVKSPDAYCRFFHRDVTGGTSRNIKRIPFDWSGFGKYKGLTFFHHIVTDGDDEFLYTMNNPLAHVQKVKLGHCWYDSCSRKIVDFTGRLSFMEMMSRSKREAKE